MLVTSGNLRKIQGFLEKNQVEVARMVDAAEKRGTIDRPKDARGANMDAYRHHLPQPRSMDLVEEHMDRRHDIFTDRMRTQDPTRKRPRRDEDRSSEKLAA